MRKLINWTAEQNQIIKDNHGKISLSEIHRRYFLDIKYNSLRSHTQKLGLFRNTKINKLPNKSFYNMNYWSNPNLINSTFAGRVATDGSIFIENRHKTVIFCYRVANKDEIIIDEFIKELEFTGIKTYVKGIRWNKELGNVGIRCSSFEKSANDLLKFYNIPIGKTFNLGPTNLIDNILNLAFCIGTIDGDGTIAMSYKGKYSSPYIGLCGCSYKFIEWFRDLMNKNFPCYEYNREPAIRTFNDSKCFGHYITGLRAAVIIDFLRRFPVPKLDRKWNNPEILQKIEEYKQKHPQYFKILPPDYFNEYLPKNLSFSNSQSPSLPVNSLES